MTFCVENLNTSVDQHRREINYPAIANALRDIGFAGTVGMDAWASGDSQTALESFRIAFT